MLDRPIPLFTIVFLLGQVLLIVPNDAHAASHDSRQKVVVSLPSSIAQALRERNRGGRGGCPESNIFVHGFRYLGDRLDRAIWFLGAPDYLCSTNSFMPVIATSDGKWMAGQAAEEDSQGGRMLPGVPTLFQQSDRLGYFLISEWQVEAPMNYMYFSAEGTTWRSLSLPPAARKDSDTGCCDAAEIRALCVAESGEPIVAYQESDQFYGSVWSANVSDAFPDTMAWIQVPNLPEDAQCDDANEGDITPGTLRKKTNDGALFELSPDWAVRIPGPTK